MRNILKKFLKLFAKQILEKYSPEIIGVTGSVGKTSSKEAIYTVLSDTFSVRQNIGNYNNEIGVPLAIIGRKTAEKNIFKWILIFIHALKLLMFRSEKYPKVLTLEMAVDKPGDMDYLLGFIRPKVGILTRIGPVHLESFKTQDKIFKEKSKLIKFLPKKGFAILNFDYEEIRSLCKETRAKCLTYGLNEGADIRAKNILITKGQTSFTLEYKEKSAYVVILCSLGKPQIYAILAGVCCGIIKNMSLDEIKNSLKNYCPISGRGNLIDGIKNIKIIDESYNASPQSVEAALENLKNLSEDGRSVAVLGDMLELGPISCDAHFNIGKKVSELGIEYLFTVGARAKEIASGAQKLGMDKNRIYCFNKNFELAKFLQKKLEEGDMVLVKGSRGMKMEEVIEEIKA